MLALLALVATVLLSLVAVIAIVVAVVSGKPKLALGLVAAYTAWCTLYVTTLIGASLSSTARVLHVNERKEFCGFYLECELHAAVASIDSATDIGEGAEKRHAHGRFLVVTLRVSNDARRARIGLVTPNVVANDRDHRQFARDTVAERMVTDEGRPATRLAEMVGAGDSVLTTVVFDVPNDARGVTLDVRDGNVFDRVLEMLLIGDEDSLLHRRSVFLLTN